MFDNCLFYCCLVNIHFLLGCSLISWQSTQFSTSYWGYWSFRPHLNIGHQMWVVKHPRSVCPIHTWQIWYIHSPVGESWPVADLGTQQACVHCQTAHKSYNALLKCKSVLSIRAYFGIVCHSFQNLSCMFVTTIVWTKSDIVVPYHETTRLLSCVDKFLPRNGLNNIRHKYALRA